MGREDPVSADAYVFPESKFADAGFGWIEGVSKFAMRDMCRCRF